MRQRGGSGWSPSGRNYDWIETERKRIREDNAEPLRTIAMPSRCWCGAVYGHDWPGQGDGAPHPPGCQREGKE